MQDYPTPSSSSTNSPGNRVSCPVTAAQAVSMGGKALRRFAAAQIAGEDLGNSLGEVSESVRAEGAASASLDTKSLKRGSSAKGEGWRTGGYAAHPDIERRTARLAVGRGRSLQQARFMVELASAGELGDSPAESARIERELRHRAGKLDQCGNWLMWRHFCQTGEVRLRGGQFCQQHLLCQTCAILRAARSLQRFMPRIVHAGAATKETRLVFLTLTMKNTADLGDMYQNLSECWGKLLQRRKDARRKDALQAARARYLATGEDQKLQSVFGGMAGGVASFEVKRGKNSGLWHAHIHAVVVRDWWMDQADIAQEWAEIQDVDTAIVDIQAINGAMMRSS